MRALLWLATLCLLLRGAAALDVSFSVAASPVLAGRRTTATLAITPASEVVATGLISVTMPKLAVQTGWSFNFPEVAALHDPAQPNSTVKLIDALNAPLAVAVVSYTAATREVILEVTGSSVVRKGVRHVLSITNVATPSGALALAGAGDVLVATNGPSSFGRPLLENARAAAPAVLSAALGAATYAADSPQAGVAGYVSVRFTASGRVPAGGSLRLTLPDLAASGAAQDGWRFLSKSPAVTFTVPVEDHPQATAVASGDGRVLTVNLYINALAEGAAVAFRVSNVRAPSGAAPAVNATLEAMDAQQRLIGSTASCAVGAVVRGALLGASVAPQTNTPGFSSGAVVTFTTVGTVLVGGKVVLTLPDVPAGVQSGWAFEDAAPTVTFTQPSTSTPTATAARAGRVLTLTLTGTHALAQATEHALTIGNVRTPSGAVPATNATLVTTDSRDKAVADTAACAVGAIARGVLLRASLAPQTNTPGIASTSTVVFTTAGRVLVGGKIELTLPDVPAGVQSGWAFEDAAPTVTFTQPSTSTPTATAARAGRVLTLTLTGTHALAQATEHAFTIGNVRTPSAVVPAANTTLRAMDDQLKLVGGTDACAVGALAAGVLSAASVKVARPTPGYSTTATVAFTTAGGVPVGGKVTVEMPAVDAQSGWRFGVSGVPAVAFIAPTSGTPAASAVIVDSSGAAAGRSLSFTLSGAALAPGAQYAFTITDVQTPSSEVAMGSAVVTTQDGGGGVIDTTNASRIDAVTLGTLASARMSLAGQAGVSIAGYASVATVSFRTAGEVQVGGQLLLTLPAVAGAQDGWTVGGGVAVVGVAFMPPSAGGPSVTAAVAEGADSRALRVTVGTAALAADTVYNFTVTNVRAPSAATPAVSAVLVTLDGQGRRIAQTTTCAVGAVGMGAVRGAELALAAPTPGVAGAAMLTFRTAGRIPAGGAIQLALPLLEEVVQLGWVVESPTAANFTTPAANAPNASVAIDQATGGRHVTITTAGRMLEQDTLVKLTLTRVRTPSSVVGVNKAVVRIQDSKGNRMANTTECALPAITAGALTGASIRMASGKATPGFKSAAIVTFTTSGQVLAGGKIVVQMPALDVPAQMQQGWSFEYPAIDFVTPAASALRGFADYDSSRRQITVHLPCDTGHKGTLKQQTTHAFRIDNTRTPSSRTAASKTTISTIDTSANTIDTTADCHVEAIAPGVPVSASLALGTPTPGFASVATLTFTTAGRVQVGGKVQLTLPDASTAAQVGWSFSPVAGPAVAFKTPVGATASTVALSVRTLTITVGSTALEQETAHSLTITNVRTPSSSVGTANATLKTMDSVDKDIDATASCTVGAIKPGQLTLATFNTATDTPGVTTTATITFTTAGQVQAGGGIRVVLPQAPGAQSGWAFLQAGIAVSFVTPSAGAPSLEPNPLVSADGRMLTVTLRTTSLAMAGRTEHALRVTNVRTPSSIVASNTIVLTTLDGNAKEVDTTNACYMDQVFAGKLAGATFATDTDTPGFKSSATVTFTTAGQVLVGGKIKIVMPDLQDGTALQSGWDFDASPAIAFTVPSGAGAPTASATFSKSTRTLTLTTAGATLGQGTQFAFRIAGVRTPSSVVGAGNVELVTQDSTSKDIDRTVACASDAVTTGTLLTATLATVKDTPGLTTNAVLQFTTAGQLQAGGKIVVVMPDLNSGDGIGSALQSGWEFDAPIGVTFTSPAVVPNATASFTPTTRTLTVTITGAALSQGTAYALTITGVRTPSSIVTQNNAALTTRDSLDKTVDHTATCTTDAIVAGTLSVASFATDVDSPGFKTNAIVRLTTAGRVQAGGKFTVEMPGLNAGNGVTNALQSGWSFEGPTVQFTAPNLGSPSVINVQASGTTLTFQTVGSTIPQGVAHSFTIRGIRTPSSVTGVAQVVLTTQDARGKDIDRSATCPTDAIVPGALRSATFATTIPASPGLKTSARVSFTTTGQVLAGGKIRIVMPETPGTQAGWRFDDRPITVTFISPEPAIGAPTLTFARYAGRILEFDLATTSRAMEQQTLHIFTISSMTTPSSAVNASYAEVTTQDSRGQHIDNTSTCTLGAINEGTLGSATLVPAVATAGVKTSASLAFTTVGQLMVGGKINIVMPDLKAGGGGAVRLGV
eukprot:g410.t1